MTLSGRSLYLFPPSDYRKCNNVFYSSIIDNVFKILKSGKEHKNKINPKSSNK